jgi:hypothetical protein
MVPTARAVAKCSGVSESANAIDAAAVAAAATFVAHFGSIGAARMGDHVHS